jgi:hypothetical protein
VELLRSWSKVRSMMRSRRLSEWIEEDGCYRLQTVRRNGLPETISVCKDSAGPMPRNIRDEESETTITPATRAKVTGGSLEDIFADEPEADSGDPEV